MTELNQNYEATVTNAFASTEQFYDTDAGELVILASLDDYTRADFPSSSQPKQHIESKRQDPSNHYIRYSVGYHTHHRAAFSNRYHVYQHQSEFTNRHNKRSSDRKRTRASYIVEEEGEKEEVEQLEPRATRATQVGMTTRQPKRHRKTQSRK
ncbi:hypothetical protein EDC96DRAFT_549767 [Choanephora cucurbitarum]|nr:hypothetical protein EDC96DRAFT_549767 [Choanephora cucurbitarum]